MKKILIPSSFLLICLLVLQISCAPRTPTTVPMDEELGTTGLPEGVRAPITANYEDYVGRYRVQGANFDYATVTVENGRLYGQAENQPRRELVPGTDRNLFKVEGLEGVEIRFNRNEQRRVTGLEIMTSQGSVPGQRVD